MKINAVIVDDERNAREVLKTIIKKFCPEVTITGEAFSVESAFHLISESKPDLVFLDVQMPMGNGFSLLQKFNPVPFSVIFVTSHDNYAIHAIKFSAIDYLMKPIEINELKCAVAKAISKKENVNQYVINFLHNINEGPIDKKIPIHIQGSVRFINTSAINYIEADGTYSNIYCEGEKFVCSKSLKEFEDFFAENSNFARISRFVIINLKCIKDYSKGDPFLITLNTGNVFESSRRRKIEILERLKMLR